MVKRRSPRHPEDRGQGSYQLHQIKGRPYWYRHFRSKKTGAVISVREDPPWLDENMSKVTQHEGGELSSTSCCVTPEVES